MTPSQILQLISAIASAVPALIAEGQAIVKAFESAINGTPGTPEHAQAVAILQKFAQAAPAPTKS